MRAVSSYIDFVLFADRYRKEYHYSIPEVAKFYKSWSGYNDELCWAAGWLYRASEIEYFSETARGYYKSLKCNYASSSISWDDKSLLGWFLSNYLSIAFLQSIFIWRSCSQRTKLTAKTSLAKPTRSSSSTTRLRKGFFSIRKYQSGAPCDTPPIGLTSSLVLDCSTGAETSQS